MTIVNILPSLREREHAEYQRSRNNFYVGAVHNVLYIKNKLLLIFILRNFNEVNLQYFQVKLQIPAFTMIGMFSLVVEYPKEEIMKIPIKEF